MNHSVMFFHILWLLHAHIMLLVVIYRLLHTLEVGKPPLKMLILYIVRPLLSGVPVLVLLGYLLGNVIHLYLGSLSWLIYSGISASLCEYLEASQSSQHLTLTSFKCSCCGLASSIGLTVTVAQKSVSMFEHFHVTASLWVSTWEYDDANGYVWKLCIRAWIWDIYNGK